MGDTLPPPGGGMPWKECHVMDERLRFVARLLEGEKMAPLCAEFGISRKTGYKIFEWYKDCGVAHGEEEHTGALRITRERLTDPHIPDLAIEIVVRIVSGDLPPGAAAPLSVHLAG